MSIQEVTARVVAPFSAKPTRLLWIMPVLMAMDGPSCVMSERPLTRIGDAAVDERLLGEWDEPASENSGSWYTVVRNLTGGIQIHAINPDGTYLVMQGFSSRVGELDFLNLQYTGAGCMDCTTDELTAWQQRFDSDYATVRASNPVNTCTWLILNYHFDETGNVHFVPPNDEVVEDAIADGELSGRVGRDAESESEFDEICFTGSRRQIRNFLVDFADELFDDEDAEPYVKRASSSGVE